MPWTVGGTRVEIAQGDITQQPDVDAVVNAANAQLQTGGGVAGAIHRAAGPGLAEECQPLAPIDVSQAVTTSGHDLPNDHVIHVLGPRYGRDEPSDELLAASYRHVLDECQAHGIRSTATPAVSTGAFGYPMEEAAGILADVLVDELPERDLEVLRVVLFDARKRKIHADALEQRTT